MIPPNAPDPSVKEVDLRIFVHSYQTVDKLTRRSKTGYIIFLNNDTIDWLSKKQVTIKTSVFGAESVAMNIGMEALRDLQYKLYMMGGPISGLFLIYGENMLVIHNTQRPDSTLKKKLNSICYHAIRESVAMKQILTGHVPSVKNQEDICTKVFPRGAKHNRLIGKLLHDLYKH